MKIASSKADKKKSKTITSEEIITNIGFLGTKGALLKALIKEKKIEKLR